MSEEKKEEKEKKEEEPKGSGNNSNKAGSEGAPQPVDEVAELKDRLLRLAAEFDNYKKRVAKETEQAKIIGKAELIKKLTTTLDEFELAINSVDGNDKTRNGLELIYSNIIDILDSEGLSVIDTNGRYDPYKHEIVLARESKEKEGTILEVVRKGYEFNGILIRPASVIVAKQASKEENEEKEGKEEKRGE